MEDLRPQIAFIKVAFDLFDCCQENSSHVAVRV